MNCRDLLRVLPDYLDDELKREACRELEAHIIECPYCRSHVQTMQETVNLSRELATPTTHEEWLVRLRRRIVDDGLRAD